MDKLSFEVNDSEIRIVGIFEAKKHTKLAKEFVKNGYVPEVLSDGAKKFYKDYWYPEFRNLLFFKENESSSKILRKEINQSLSFIKTKDEAKNPLICIDAEVIAAEVILFPNDLHFFSIEIKPKENTIQQIADLIFCAREFNKENLD